MKDDLISRLSELRCQYNCFDENERDAYHTLSEAIKALSDVPDTNFGNMISRQAALDAMRQYAHYDDFDVSVVDEDVAVIALKDLPPVDAVEVVRCKDCKYANYWYSDVLRCDIWAEVGAKVFRDGFCNYGERKDPLHGAMNPPEDDITDGKGEAK